jgi:hypothetical protein
VEYGCLRGWDSVGVLINQELIVGSVDRVVQYGPMKTDLNVLDGCEGPIKHEGVADLGRHGVADAFFFAALCGVRPVGVSKRDPYRDARTPLIGESAKNSSIFGEE